MRQTVAEVIAVFQWEEFAPFTCRMITAALFIITLIITQS